MSTEVSMFNLRTFEIFGFIEIACFLGLVLFGVSTIQVYTYFRSFSDDRLFLKALVVLLYLGPSCQNFIIFYRLQPFCEPLISCAGFLVESLHPKDTGTGPFVYNNLHGISLHGYPWGV